MKQSLTIENVIIKAKTFCIAQSKTPSKELYGVTDGKAVGTHIEHKFQQHLAEKYELKIGSSAKGIDLPSVDIDIKVTLQQLAEQILKIPPEQGYLTISNTLQWRLQYQRIVTLSENIDGISRIIDKMKTV